ncbi:hypothetical protein PPERSA_05080 [Pseudocohnilembus persalinus]|uniref:Signal recognition particle subunit SRP72 n=1 Tax=Pseudocohnilembus persalinus TaxID=266149 RepID=A0A0V0QVM8_PSEPJ|nr:hypothetical protein PPERSA_05080 [Pseudocohnilembus persalinus]|eukprot:KRX06467.1 hypothetical protein PPERSA_05080 [Pseudocohnilembus persalinus]
MRQIKSFKHAAFFFQNKPSGKDQAQFFAYIYYLYKNGQLELALQQIEKDGDKKDIQLQILKAQILYAQKKYNEATEIYLNLIKKNEGDQEDILTNCLCVQTHREFLNMQEDKDYKQLEELMKSQDIGRESLFNFGLLLSLIGRNSEALNVFDKFEAMVKKQEKMSQLDKEDLIMAQIQRDFILLTTTSISQQELEEKLKQYEDLSQKNIGDQNLKAVINNNIVSLRGLTKSHQYGDSIKLIEEAISKPWRQTEEQLLTFKFNKLLLALNKNKFAECQNTLREIEKGYSQETLFKFTRYVTLKSYLLLKSQKIEELDQLVNQMNQFLDEGIISENLAVPYFLIQSEIYRQLGQRQKILELFINLHKRDASILENQVLCSFIFSVIQKDGSLLEQARPILKEIAQNTSNLEILQVLGDLYYKEKENDIAKEIFEKILSKAPDSRKYRLKLAQFYANEDPEKADQLMSQLDEDFEYMEADQIEKLENELAQTKVEENKANQKQGQQQQQEQEKKKKKKRKIRYPKNFDPENPGPKPDPERWLPKYERKEYRKKKGYSGKNNTQGSASAQGNLETKGTFNSNYTADKTVSTNQVKGTKNKRRGKK